MGSQYYNYKDTNSVVLLVVAGSNYEKTWVDVGMNRRISDGGVLKRSKLGKMLEKGSFNLPASESFRSSRPEVFCKKDVLKNFSKFTGKHLFQSLFLIEFFNKLFKKKTQTQVFSCEFCEIFKNTFFMEHRRWLLLIFAW